MQRGPLVPILHVYLVSFALFVTADIARICVPADVELLEQELEPLLVRVAGAEVQHSHTSLVATRPAHL